MMNQPLLGSLSFDPQSFPQVRQVLQELKSEDNMRQNAFNRQTLVNQKLLTLIQDSDSSFLLREVSHYIESVVIEGILDKYNITMFELWLNQFSNASEEVNRAVRSKIVGKALPRIEYQEIFPIGMDKIYEGTHIVTAHGSPDLDTIVSSFWGYLDAFAARVGTGLHVWNVPGGPPSGLVELDLLFKDIFGQHVFKSLSRNRTALSLSSYDLLTQKGLVKKTPKDLIFEFTHQRLQSAVIIVDDEGRFVGDWRSIDVEGVRQVVNLFNTHLRFLEYFFQVNLISLFTRQDLTRQDFQKAIDQIYQYQFKTFEPSKELTQQQFDYLNDYMSKVLLIQGGIDATFDQFVKTMEQQTVSDFTDFHNALRELYLDDLFDKEGNLIEDRPLIFSRLERVVTTLSLALRKVRSYVDSLNVGFRIKEQVLGYRPTFLGHRSDIVEIKSKMEAYPYLTVNFSSTTGDMHPLGVIYSSELSKPILGTVSLRDFSNHEETKIPPYLEVISAIDHHKTSLTNRSPSKLMVADVQSVNVLVADMSFRVNDRFSFGGMSLEDVNRQLENLDDSTALNLRLKQRLLMRKKNMMMHETSLIDPQREMLEYLHYLYAIFDDTDLLTKVSAADIKCVTSLVNRLKSLMLAQEVEVVHFDDLDESHLEFVSQAAKRLLQHEDLYSLYNKVYKQREKLISKQLNHCKGTACAASALFEDTKIQNGCARVGQKKIFAQNVPHLREHAGDILKAWTQSSIDVVKERPEVDLHLMMISTIASAEELFKGNFGNYDHQDELWVYIPHHETAVEHLKLFLSAFSKSHHLCHEDLRVEFLGENSQELATIFKESFVNCQFEFNAYNIPVAIIHYKASTINSRKSQIAPFLPR